MTTLIKMLLLRIPIHPSKIMTIFDILFFKGYNEVRGEIPEGLLALQEISDCCY